MIQKTMNFIFKKNRLFKERSIHSNRTLQKRYSLSQEKSSTFKKKKCTFVLLTDRSLKKDVST